MKMFKLASKITGFLTAAAMLWGSSLVASAADESTTFYRSLGYTDAEIATISEASVVPPNYVAYIKAENALLNSTGSVTTAINFNSTYLTCDGIAASSCVVGTPNTSTSSITPANWYSNTTSCNFEMGSYASTIYRVKFTAIASKCSFVQERYALGEMSSIITAPSITLAYKDGTLLTSEQYDDYFTNCAGTKYIVALGDVNKDHVISDADRTMMNNYMAGMTPSGWNYDSFIAADVNFDNSISIADTVKLGRVLSGDLTSFW